MTFEEKLREYARLAVRAGIAVRPGQEVLILAPLETAPFVRLCAREAYAAGAKDVVVEWSDDELTRLHYDHTDAEACGRCPDGLAQRRNALAERGAAILSIRSQDPAALAGVDAAKPAAYIKALHTECAPFYKAQRSGAVCWSIIGAAGPAWAKAVFPGLPEDEAVARLWEAIFKTVRVGEGDALAAWQAHRRSFEKRIAWLNAQNFTALHYKNALGTDITVGLPENVRWAGGGSAAADGRWHFANMPTEEVFTSPDRLRAEGTVVASMPLNYSGSLVRNFRFTFHEGRVVDFDAKEGREVLRGILDEDDNARYLGECALVPAASPISEMGLLFYDTLYDENASCHFALGRGFASAVEGGGQLDEQGLLAKGVNQSDVHVDFMLGTKDLAITGVCADGRRVPVFVNGNWAEGVEG